MALLRVKFSLTGAYTDLPTPAPENYYVQTTHEEKSYVDDTGYLHRDVVRRNRAKVFCGWDLLKPAEFELLQQCYDVDYVYLEYTDNYNDRVSKKMYAGPLDSKAKVMDKVTFEISIRTKIQMNFVEY